MGREGLIAVLVGLVLGSTPVSFAYAQDPGQAQPRVERPKPTLQPALPTPTPPPEVATPDLPLAAPKAEDAPATVPQAPQPVEEAPPSAAAQAQADPVVATLRALLGDAALRKQANEADLAALESFYTARATPLWITEMGFTAKAQAALFEIEKAADFGLDAAEFDLPRAEMLPKDADAQALAELKLDLAILQYARHARGGRFTPSEISSLFDQEPPLRDPKLVLAEIATSEAPDAYLRSLHPQHVQFVRLREALLKARVVGEDGRAAPYDVETKRLIINMERWRWMPEDLGQTYVLNNSAAFMLYVFKEGKRIYADKILVGTIGYATPVFSADMRTIVFNPDWIAPETVVKENLWPPLQRGNFSILRVHKLFVSYNGKPVDPTKIDWRRVDPLNFTFLQKAGPHNNLGKVKFLYPNRHTVYMHDTLPVRKKYFKQKNRMIGHECVRMEQPLRFAEILLAEANGMSPGRVKELWDKGNNSAVTLEKKIPVHMVYFTATVDDEGKVETATDIYGLDRKMAAAMFGSTTGFPQPPPEPKKPPAGEASISTSTSTRAADNDISRAMQGFFGD